jgi:hypothetical protein
MTEHEWLDDYSDELDENEYPDDDDLDQSSDDLLRCPECDEEVYEDAEQCPYCGQYIVHSTHPFHGRSGWWIALGALGIIAVILALAFSTI